MVENFNPPNTSQKSKRKNNCRTGFKISFSSWTNTKEKSRNPKYTKVYFYKGRLTRLETGMEMSLIRMAYRIITTEVYICESGYLKILKRQFHVNFILEKEGL